MDTHFANMRSLIQVSLLWGQLREHKVWHRLRTPLVPQGTARAPRVGSGVTSELGRRSCEGICGVTA